MIYGEKAKNNFCAMGKAQELKQLQLMVAEEAQEKEDDLLAGDGRFVGKKAKEEVETSSHKKRR